MLAGNGLKTVVSWLKAYQLTSYQENKSLMKNRKNYECFPCKLPKFSEKFTFQKSKKIKNRGLFHFTLSKIATLILLTNIIVSYLPFDNKIKSYRVVFRTQSIIYDQAFCKNSCPGGVL